MDYAIMHIMLNLGRHNILANMEIVPQRGEGITKRMQHICCIWLIKTNLVSETQRFGQHLIQAAEKGFVLEFT